MLMVPALRGDAAQEGLVHEDRAWHVASALSIKKKEVTYALASFPKYQPGRLGLQGKVGGWGERAVPRNGWTIGALGDCCAPTGSTHRPRPHQLALTQEQPGCASSSHEETAGRSGKFSLHLFLPFSA